MGEGMVNDDKAEAADGVVAKGGQDLWVFVVALGGLKTGKGGDVAAVVNKEVVAAQARDVQASQGEVNRAEAAQLYAKGFFHECPRLCCPALACDGDLPSVLVFVAELRMWLCWRAQRQSGGSTGACGAPVGGGLALACAGPGLRFPDGVIGLSS